MYHAAVALLRSGVYIYIQTYLKLPLSMNRAVIHISVAISCNCEGT